MATAPTPLAAGEGIPRMQPSAPPATPNALAAFASSPLGQQLSNANRTPAAAGNYLQQFQDSIAQARGDINQQLAGTLHDIQTQQALAHGDANLLPGQINRDYQTVHQLMNTGQQAAQGGMAQPGLNAPTATNTGGSLQQYMAPERAAIAGEQAGELANVPLIQQGVDQAAAQQQAAANNTALGDQSALAQQQAGIYGQLGVAGINAQTAASQQNQGFLDQMMLDRLQNQLNPPGATTPATGPYATYGLTQAQVQAAQATPQYNHFTSLINGARGGTNQAQVANAILTAGAANPTILATLQAENPNFFKGAQAGPLSVPGAITETPYNNALLNFFGRPVADPGSIGRGFSRIFSAL